MRLILIGSIVLPLRAIYKTQSHVSAADLQAVGFCGEILFQALIWNWLKCSSLLGKGRKLLRLVVMKNSQRLLREENLFLSNLIH